MTRRTYYFLVLILVRVFFFCSLDKTAVDHITANQEAGSGSEGQSGLWFWSPSIAYLAVRLGFFFSFSSLSSSVFSCRKKKKIKHLWRKQSKMFKDECFPKLWLNLEISRMWSWHRTGTVSTNIFGSLSLFHSLFSLKQKFVNNSH